MIEQIKQALRNSTPGTWRYVDGRESGTYEIVFFSQQYGVDDLIAVCMREIDSNLIANAPQWLASLVSQVEEMQKTLEDIAESDDEWYVGRMPMREYARRYLKSLKEDKPNDPKPML